MYNEHDPNIEYIRAVAENIAARLTKEYGIQITVQTKEHYCLITLPCHSETIILISEVDAGMLPISVEIIYGGDRIDEYYSVDYKDENEFTEVVVDCVKSFFGRLQRVTRTSRVFGGVSTRIEYLENGEWKLQYEDTDKSFIMRLFTWNNKTTVSEYDFRTE